MADAPFVPLNVDLQGKVAIVTGASRGLGQAMAMALGRCGAKVACLARNADKLAEVVAAIRAAGGEAEAYSCDVTDKESVDPTVESVVEKWDKIDILVNNAGVTRDTLLPIMSDEQWDEVLDTNLKGAFLFSRAVVRHMMKARYGRIINISSVVGLVGNPGQANYSASKAGLIGMTRTVAREIAKRGVTVNAICPGFIESDMTAKLGDALKDEVKKRVPAKRMGQADEVANVVLFLAGDVASYITGQVITIDGGMTA